MSTYIRQAQQLMKNAGYYNIPIVVAITGILGWVKKQPSIKKGH